MNTNKKVIIGIAAGLTVLIGIIIAARPNSSRESRANIISALSISELVADEPIFDFGEISMAKGVVKHTFKVRNSEASEVKIAKIYTSCMCTTAKLRKNNGELGPFGMPGHGPIPKINQVFLPGEEAEVEVKFDPAAHGPSGIGRIERVVYLESSSADILELRFTAQVTP